MKWMKYWKNRFLTGYLDYLLLCFLGGVAAGTVTANLLSGELQSQIGYFDGWFSGGKILTGAQKVQMYWYVLRQREIEFLMAWFLTLTVFSRPGFCCLAAWTGGISAVTISIFTGQFGMLGAAAYVATIMPQYLFYLPVWLILAGWAQKSEKKLRLLGLVVLILVTAVGAAAEVYVNPYLLRFFYGTP